LAKAEPLETRPQVPVETPLLEDHLALGPPKIPFAAETRPAAAAQGFTINYNTVSIIEYIRFASKICNVNFIFNEADLDFTVTVVSDAPITPQNVMGTLIQVLRIHGLYLLEQDNNLVIHKSPEVTQMATLFTDSAAAKAAPIITRILRVKEAKAETVAGVIRPMMSASALLEVLPETKQLILTDVTTNVDKVAALIEILDSPTNQLSVQTYTALNNSPEHLVELASQIMTPIAQGNPFILVPQPMANAVYIVSTAELIDKTVSILKSLDVPPKKEVLAQRKLKGENIFVYKAMNHSSDEVLRGLVNIAENLQKSGIPEGDLVNTMESARSIKETNSITFVGSKDSIAKVKEFLTVLDAPGKEAPSVKSSFFVYRPKNRSAKEIDAAMKEMAENLKGAKGTEESLVHSIQNSKINSMTNTILFSGDESQFGNLQNLLNTVDTPVPGRKAPAMKNDFFLYKIQHASYEDLQTSLKSFTKNLDKSNVQEEGLIETIENMKPIAETNSALFSGPEPALKRLQEIVPSFDSSIIAIPVSNQFFIYKSRNQKGEQLAKSLREVTSDLKSDKFRDPAFVRTLESMKYVKNTDSLLFTGDANSLKRLEELIGTLDTAQAVPKPAEKFLWLFTPKSASREKTETYFKQLSSSLDKDTESDVIETIRSMKWIDASHSFLFQGTPNGIARVKQLAEGIDQPVQAAPQKDFFLYTLQNAPYEKTDKYLGDLAESLNKKGGSSQEAAEAIRSRKWIADSRSYMFQGTDPALARVKELLQSYDTTATAAVQKNFFLYQLKYASQEKADKYLDQLSKSLAKEGGDKGLIETIDSRQWIADSHSFMFQGADATLSRLKDLLQSYDTPAAAAIQRNSFLYQLKYAPQDKTNQYLDELAKSLGKEGSDKDLAETIESKKWIENSHSFMFQGTDASITRLKDLLQTYDTPAAATAQKNFFLYQLKYAPQDKANQYLEELMKSLGKEGPDKELSEAIDSRKWIENSHSFMFQGADPSLARLKDLLQSYDTPAAATVQKNFFLYELKYAPQDKANQYLDQLSKSLGKEGGDKELVETINARKWIENSHSFLFNGPSPALDRIKELLGTFDKPDAQSAKPGYFIYKLQSAPGNVVEDELEALAKDLKSSGMKDEKTLAVIRNMRYVKETNSLLLTGDPKTIEEVRAMIAEYDYPRTSPTGVSSNFFMYKPQHQSASQIEKSLHDVASNLKKAGLADPSLLMTIDTAKYVETTNSLIFTGNADAIQKIQTLLKDIDIPPKEHAPIQHIGKTTFLLYKLKVAGGDQVVTSLKAMTADLKKSGSADPDLIHALSTMKYIRETNSLFFTGTEDSLKKVQTLVEQFDVTSLAPPAPHPAEKPAAAPGQPNFFLYKPVSLPAADLEKLMSDFAENVRSSGLSDPELFAAISSMRVVEKTQSLVFTGTPKALDQVKDLLKAFDIPSNLPASPIKPSLEPSIQPIDNTSFLVYKLQFHKGDEIQGALRQIAKDLIGNNAPVNANLLNSINSIQWLDVTNSLLCSGDQETLTRLKELIKNLDIPLKQVFIEILVIETTLTNALLFGLEWGGNYKFTDKFGISSFNTVPPVNVQSPFPDAFVSKLSGLTPPSPPTPIGNIPPVSGFDLGVIGEVIKHNGETFLTLGSLLNALQSDTETTIITAPKILGQDGRTSTIFSGANIPFTGSFVNNTTSGATVLTSNIEYRDIGLNLTITPVLGNSDIVTLDINLDRSQTATDVTGQSQLNFQSQTANGIVTSKTTMTTTVHVPDRNFLVLSGFVNNSNTKTKQGIPCLGGLPMIGAAFSQQNDTISHQNVVIFLRPFIINSIDDMRRVTSDQEEYFRDLSLTPFLEHNYNEAIELIKSIEDE